MRLNYKKQNICLQVKLTGPEVADVKIIKAINVQMNPGRGAKVVTPRLRGSNYHQHRINHADGTNSHNLIRLKTAFVLGMVNDILVDSFDCHIREKKKMRELLTVTHLRS